MGQSPEDFEGKGGAIVIGNWLAVGFGKAEPATGGEKPRRGWRRRRSQLRSAGCFYAKRRDVQREDRAFAGEVQLPGDRLRRCALIESINERQ